MQSEASLLPVLVVMLLIGQSFSCGERSGQYLSGPQIVHITAGLPNVPAGQVQFLEDEDNAFEIAPVPHGFAGFSPPTQNLFLGHPMHWP